MMITLVNSIISKRKNYCKQIVDPFHKKCSSNFKNQRMRTINVETCILS